MGYMVNKELNRRRFDPLPIGFEPIGYLFRKPLITDIDAGYAARRGGEISDVVERLKAEKGYGWMPAPQQLSYEDEGGETESYLTKTTPRMTPEQFRRNYSLI